MPIAIQAETGSRRLCEEPFKDEAELQSCLERCPYLLASDGEPAVATVQREVGLPSAGILDLLVVDEEGLPIAVEVKLARNAQSRREVIAQAFDYVADLSQLTYDELDEIVEGALSGVLAELVAPEQFVGVRKACATNLRAGRVRLIVAVDSANEDLIRIVRYVNDHSDLDIRLVCVSKFDNGAILVPRTMVASAADGKAVSRTHTSAEMDPALDAVLQAYGQAMPPDMHLRGRARDYRFLARSGWPAGLHYQFQDYRGETGVELHLESEGVRALSSVLSPLGGQELLPGISMEWDAKWSGRRGRLVAKVPKDQPPQVAAEAMQALVSRTEGLVDEFLVGRTEPAS
ncbi:MAG: hypothetical protein HY321_00420 [Armatimonadetes bacterium]|nr:hypothetical protein [Armatimonadota bacterium]